MKLALCMLLVFGSRSTLASGNAVNEACRHLCENEGECVRKCVAQAELFELRAEFINAVTDFTRGVDDRMRALRSGADLPILALCKQTGWSLDNMMICLRSYPTLEVIRNCKRLSPRQDDQVQCVRLGKTEAEVEACNQLVPGSDRRLRCLERRVTAREMASCQRKGGDSYQRIQCLEEAELDHDEKQRPAGVDLRIGNEGKLQRRQPASSAN